jgi:hypothetical protein
MRGKCKNEIISGYYLMASIGIRDIENLDFTTAVLVS